MNATPAENTDAELAESEIDDLTEAEVAEDEEPKYRMSVEATIEDAGPCRKHIHIRVPRADIDHFYQAEVSEFADSAEVPGFRVGHVPAKLVEKRFRKELSAQVKQKLLVQSLEQVADDRDLDPISEPNIDVESIELPEEGDFEYEFDIEVRPEFDLPEYEGLKIERPMRTISDEDVEAYRTRYLEQYGSSEDVNAPAEPGDYLTLAADFKHNETPLHKIGEFTAQLRPVLRFQDAELDGFDELMAGVQPGESKTAELTVSLETGNIEMRGETVTATFTVKKVKRRIMPELTSDFFNRIGVESEEELDAQIRSTLQRQVQFQQRQVCRRQVLEKITDSADWELPEEMVLKQVENALRREVLEMQQAGFTTEEIRSRENEIRQRAVSNTKQALKEHFVLDKIATNADLDVTPDEIDFEIQLMAMQRGESPRRVRARLRKSGMDENLAAQIRERKAVDFILDKARFEDVPMEPPVEDRVAAVSYSVCGVTAESARDDEDED